MGKDTTQEQESLMNLKPKTDFELLLWERSRSKELLEQNKALSLELGMRISELEELKDEMKKHQLGQMILKCKNYKDRIDTLKKNLKKAKQDNEILTGKLALHNYQEKYGEKN